MLFLWNYDLTKGSRALRVMVRTFFSSINKTYRTYRLFNKELLFLWAFAVALVRRLISAEFAFLFMVSNPYLLEILLLKAKIFRTYDFKHEEIENLKKKLKNHHLTKFYQ